MELIESGGEAFTGLFQQVSPATVEEPEWDSIESPRSTVMTFIEAMNHVAQGRDEAWSRAERTLADFDGDNRKAAIDLLAVLDRLPAVSPGSIPGHETVKELNISSYELFPRGIDSGFVYRVLNDAPRGSISLRKSDQGWQFDGSTLAGVSELLGSLRKIPPRPRLERKGDLFLNTVQPTFTKTPWIGWVKMLGILVTTLGLCWCLLKALSIGANRLAKTDDILIAPIMRGLRMPAVVVLFTLGLATALPQIHLEPALSTLRWSILQAFFVIALIWLTVEFFELFVVLLHRGLVRGDNPYAEMLSIVVRRCVRGAAIVLVAIFVLQNVLEWNVTALIGGIGVAALAVSLAAKDAVANLFGAITVFANRPFVSGDWVRFEERIGEVEDVSLQVTRIRLLTGAIWSVPNMKFIDQAVENLSMRNYVRRIFYIDLPYDTKPEELKMAVRIARETLTSDEVVGDGEFDLEDHPPKINFKSFGAYSLKFRIDYWYMLSSPENPSIQRDSDRDYLDYLEHCTKVNGLLKERFERAGLPFAFPTQTIHLNHADRGDGNTV